MPSYRNSDTTAQALNNEKLQPVSLQYQVFCSVYLLYTFYNLRASKGRAPGPIKHHILAAWDTLQACSLIDQCKEACRALRNRCLPTAYDVAVLLLPQVKGFEHLNMKSDSRRPLRSALRQSSSPGSLDGSECDYSPGGCTPLLCKTLPLLCLQILRFSVTSAPLQAD